MRWVIMAAMLAAALPVKAEETAQQIFDAASAAADAGKCDEAVKSFAAIEDGPSARKNPVVRAMIDLRKGRCLIRLDREEEGRRAIETALPVLAAKGETFAGDVREGRLTLGKIASAALDYDRAITHYRAALDLSRGAYRYTPLVSLGQLLAFDPGNEALDMMNEAKALVEADTGLDKETLAGFQTLYARVLMNKGMHKKAYDELKGALKKQGGLRLKVSAEDIVTRSDLAIAALLNGQRDDAREYLAYTGAGRLKNDAFDKSQQITPPPCGGAAGIKPDDYAIVEFSLLEDGSIMRASPIFTTGGRAVALEFARAVRDWSWKPEDAKTIPPLFRYLTRVELRCTYQNGERPSTLQPLMDAFEAWAEQRAPATAALPNDARGLPMLRDALSTATTRNDFPAIFIAQLRLAMSNLLPLEERHALLGEAEHTAASLDYPLPVRMLATIERLHATGGPPEKHAEYRKSLRAMLGQPKIAADPVVGGVIRLLLAQRLHRYPALPDALQVLTAVAEDGRLPERHPLRVSALLERANILAGAGDMEGARQSFASTGLTEQQCALLGIVPALRSSGVGSWDYPQEAQMMGFEGWVRTEFDIAADGSTITPRATISYPPFIFSDAAARASKSLRYRSTYRPEGGAACTAFDTSFRFMNP